MLTSEIKVNGRLIANLTVINMMIEEKGKTLYRVEYYRVASGIVINTDLFHAREDGAEKLVQLAMAKVMRTKEFKAMESK